MSAQQSIRSILHAAGACAVGFAPAEPVPEREATSLDEWLARGYNAGMEYMHNWREIRLDPRLLLEGARTVISMAFAYPESRGMIASYAVGYDYHDVLRRVLNEAVAEIKGQFGGEYRICIDSAPILERYWAERCGVGVRGRNGLIIVPGIGQRVFLAEIVTTLSLTDSNPSSPGDPNTAPLTASNDDKGVLCPEGCDRCQKACPASALGSDGRVDARRCLSYLTIEHRGDWDETGEQAMSTPAGRHTLFGCELCLRACPLNSSSDGHLTAFQPREEIMSLSAADILRMSQDDFSTTFRGSPIKRTKLIGLQRNARNLLSNA